jgi:Transposase DDE domain
MGGAGRVVAGVAPVPGGTGPARPTRLERELHRRELRSRQKGDAGVGKTKRGKGTKWMVVVDGQGVPLGNHLDRASPAEVILVHQTLAQVRVPRAGRGRPKSKPQRLIADRAYDSDPLRRRLQARGIELICPHRKNRHNAPTQDGRALRRYRRR